MTHTRFNKVIATLFTVCLVGGSIFASYSYALSDQDKIEEAREVVLQEAKAIASHSDLLTNKTEIGMIEDQPLYSEEIELFTIKMEAQNYKNPKAEALNHLKKFKKEEQLAEEYGIAVSDEEVIAFTQEQRKLIENSGDIDLINFMKEYISTLNMTEDEYWTQYKIIENKRFLTHNRVQGYIKNNELDSINEEDINCTINDEKYNDLVTE